MMQVLPPLLPAKGTVGIISPSRWPDPAWLDKTEDVLKEVGYQTVIHTQNYLHDGQLAGSDAARAEAIMDMFLDKTIDTIMCGRGGTGSIRLLDKLNYKIIKQNPKPFIGFSDITLLLQAIQKRCGFITYHGPMGWNFGNPFDPRTLKDFIANVGDHHKKHLRLNYPEVTVHRAGKVEGTLVGGNVTLLQHLIGSPYDWTGKDSIFFVEDVDEPLYKIDRAFQHLALAGKFKDVRAVIVGEMVGISDGEIPYGRDLKQIITEAVPPEIPLCFDFPCGHGDYITTLPVGAFTHANFSASGVELSYHFT